MYLLNQEFSPIHLSVNSLHNGEKRKAQHRVENTSLLKSTFLFRGSCQNLFLIILLYHHLKQTKFLWNLRFKMLNLMVLINRPLLHLLSQSQVNLYLIQRSPPMTYILIVRECKLGHIRIIPSKPQWIHKFLLQPLWRRTLIFPLHTLFTMC